jgi:O-antigen ligase
VSTILWRALVVLVTALIVARPMVLGEDPGLQADFSDPGGMLLTLLWLLAAAGWALWRLLARRPGDRSEGIWGGRGRGAFVEVGLLATVGVVFLSAEVAAPYRHPARLIAWEWFGLFAAFFVVRRLAARGPELHGLFTALVATAASVSAHAVYQAAVELPQLRRQLASNQEALQEAVVQALQIEPDTAYLDALRQRAEDGHVFGTFAHPNSLAGYLVLLIPGLIGAAILLSRRGAARWKVILAWAFALLGAAALWLSHSRGAQLAAVLIALAVAAISWRRFLWDHKGLALMAAAVVAVAAYGVHATGAWDKALGKDSGTAGQRVYYWRTTGQIIGEHPWLGVGPGNFGNAYTRLMEPAAGETIKDPHNFALEIWATSGVFALVALLATLAVFFVVMLRGLLATAPADHPADEQEPERAAAPVRWEYYVGGMIGLVLAFWLAAGGQPSSELVGEAVAAGLRSIVWFAAFGLLEHIAWPGRGRALVLATGVAALLLNLCVSGGIAFPSLATPLWVAVALGLASLGSAMGQPGPQPADRHEQPTHPSRSAVWELIPLPLFIGLVLAYATYVFDPVTTAMARVEQSRQNARALTSRQKNRKGAVTPADFERFVIDPLEEAVRLDLGNAHIHCLLAERYGYLWRMAQLPQLKKKALAHAVHAQQLDPQGRQGYLAEYEVRESFFSQVKDPQGQKQEKTEDRQEYEKAAEALLRYEPFNPSDPTLHYLIASAFFKAGDESGGRQEAALAVELDAPSGNPRLRKLTEPQRRDVQKWLAARPGS